MSQHTGSVPDTPRAEHWSDTAACQLPENADHRDVFFASTRDHVSIAAAKTICGGCPVLQECGEYALMHRIQHGVWGGMTTAQRKCILRRLGKGTGQPKKQAAPAKRRKVAECGTNTGYGKHIRDKTKICEPCRRAHADADRRLHNTGTSLAIT